MSGQNRYPILDPCQDCALIGVARALIGIRDAVLIVHGRLGCYSGCIGLCSLCSSHANLNITYSGLRSEDMTFGGEKRLENAIKHVERVLKPKLIVVATTTSTEIIGDNVEDIISSIKTNAKIIHVRASGYTKPEWQGYEEVLMKLADLVKDTDEKDPDAVNIIGFRPDMPHWYADLLEIKRILESCEIRINTVISWCSVEDIENMARASLNVCLGGDGLFLCEVLWRRFKIPYIVVPYPYGIKNTIELIEKTCKKLNKNPNNKFIEEEIKFVEDVMRHNLFYVSGVYRNLSAAIIGESSRVFYLARFLHDELGIDVDLVCVRCRNAMTEQLCQEYSNYGFKILIEPDRYVFEKELENLDVEVIYGSTYDRLIALKLGIGLVRLFYPSLDEVSLGTSPVAGIRGSLTIIEKTINEIFRLQEKRELAYLAKINSTRFTSP